MSVERPLTAGTTLRTLRQQAELSEQDVINQLKISHERLAIMEKDLYPEQRLDIYFRGHLRNYCQLLQHDVDQIFQQLNDQGIMLFPESASTPKPPRPTPPFQLSLSTWTLISALSVLVLLGIFQQFHHRDITKKVPPPYVLNTVSAYEKA